jgi:hypothetical protein
MLPRHKVMINFDNFFDRTIAQFTPSPLPYREPDFVSASGSAYWNIGHAVIRASDHWAGQHGCTGQASCIWSLSQQIAPGAWGNGIAEYAAFARRRDVHVFQPVTESDRCAARLIHNAGGALPYPAWRASGLTLPQWATKVFRGPSLLPDAALRLFQADPLLHHAICAPRASLDEILGGAAVLRIGSRRSLPQDHGMAENM